MDPHSRISQFNQRQPKSGPPSRLINTMPPKDSPGNPVKNFHKSKAASPTASFLIRRPIATNSRIKHSENLRRDMYLAFVNNALEEKSYGKSGPFDELVNQFSSKNTDAPQQPGQMRLWILALSHVVSRLERTHSALVEAVVNMPWTTFDSATVKSYTVFIGMLLSARPEYLSLVLSKIVQGFTHLSGIQALDAGIPESSSRPLTRRIIYDRLHYFLSRILSLIPTLPSTLQPLLIRFFPHKRQNQVAQSTYIRNLLRISTYCPELGDKILATIVDHAIQIDVEIQVEIEELEDGENLSDHDVFELDPFDVVVGQEGDELDSDIEDGDDEDGSFSDLSSDAGYSGDDVPRGIPTNIKHVEDMIKKLDAILTLIFQHFSRVYTHLGPLYSSLPESRSQSPPSPALPPLSSPLFKPSSSSALEFSSPTTPVTPIPTLPIFDSTRTSHPKLPKKEILLLQFNVLLSIFDRIILSTFKSRYTQFLIFWFTSLDPEFVDVFQGMLIDRALFSSSSDFPSNSNSSTTSELTRAAAASYIGSFVSRATFVDREGTRRVLSVLCDFLHAHLDGVEEAIRENGLAWVALSSSSQHTVFYAVAQAMFLIFCFRWRDLLEEIDVDEEGLGGGMSAPKIGKDNWMPQLDILKRAIMSVLNPLKVCSPGVVMQFARVAHQVNFLYCYTILESNKRSEYGSGYSNNSPVRKVGTHFALLRGELNVELNTFFPFDPYRLPRSNVFIQGVYREWSSVAIDDDDDEEEDDAQVDNHVPSSGGYLAIPQRRRKDDDGGLGESLGAMSISPVRVATSVVMQSGPLRPV